MNKIILSTTSTTLHKGETPVGTGPIVTPPVAEPPYLCQEPISETQRRNDQNLASLSRTQITTGILYDRVAGLASLEMFNQTGTTGQLDASGFGHWLQAYYEMHAADYNNPGTDPCRQLLRDNALSTLSRGQVLVGALRYRFNYIDSNAVRNNQLVFPAYRGGPLYDIGGRVGSPYLEREVVVGAALVDTLEKGAATFRLDPGYVFTNTGRALTSVSINFGNGGAAQTFVPGQSAYISYPSAGRKTLTFSFLYADGYRQTTRSGLFVKRAAVVGALARGNPDYCFSAPFTAGRSFQAAFGQAEASYYYSTSPAKLCTQTKVNVTKPVILIDGFDHDGSRNAEKLYNNSLSYLNATGQPNNLGEELRAQGFDVVVMDMPNVTRVRMVNTIRAVSINGYVVPTVVAVPYEEIVRRSGSDYIERNGLALVSLIEELSDQLDAAGSREEIVIVGPSMGGQIARYALAYMEANNIPHRTRLYIALDSPHNGANIPIGLQRFVRHFANDTQDSKLVNALESIDSPASREMTAQHYDYDRTNAALTPFRPHPDRLAFMSTLNTLRPGGFPANVRRVAVTNGALSGAAQRDRNGRALADNDQAFLLEQQGAPASGVGGVVQRVLGPIGLIGRAITTASARVNLAPGYANTSRVLRAYKITSGETLYDATGPAGSCGLDAGPGGYRKFFGEVADGNSNAGLFQARNFYSVRDRASFIPMLSALGCTYPGYNNCTGVSTRILVCDNETPFDAYYGPARVNEEHTQLTAGNVAFLKDEILKKTPKPVLVGAAPAELCSVAGGATATATVLPECLLPGRTRFATTYAWTVTRPGVLFAGGATLATGTSVRLAAVLNANTAASVKVKATRAGFAPDSLTFNIMVTPTSNFALDYIAPNAYAHDFIVPALENVTFGMAPRNYDPASIRWYVNGSATPALDPNGMPVSGGAFATNVGNGIRSVLGAMNTFTIRAEGVSLCDGHLEVQTLQLRLGTGPNFPTNRPAPTGHTLQTYPNPAQETVNIMVGEIAGRASDTAEKAEVRLFDPYGHLVRQMQGSGSRYSLDTHGLPVGMYNLEVVRGGQVLRKHIEVSH